MPDATVTLGLNAAQLTAGLRAASSNVDKFAKGASSSFSRLSASLGVLGGGFTLGAIVKRGFEFNQTMQDGEVAIANVLKSFKGLNDEAARGEAANAIKLLIEAEPKAAGDLQDLTQGFIATAAAAASAGISVEQNVDLVARFANALSNSGMSVEQLNQELRSVLTANITSDSFVGKLLEGKGLDNKRISQLAQEGKLYGEIVKILGAMGEAGDTAQAALSALSSAFDKAAGAATKGLFNESVNSAKDLSAIINELLPVLEKFSEVTAIGLAKVRDSVPIWRETSLYVGIIAASMKDGATFAEAQAKAAKFMEASYNVSAIAAKSIAKSEKDRKADASGGSSAGGSVSSIIEKQKKDTYDVAKNIQDQAKAAQSVLDPYRQFLDYLEEEKKKLDDIKAKKDADKQATQSKIESQKEAAQSLQDEIRLLEVRANGDEKAIKAAERELALKQKVREIQTQLQIDAKTALDIAKQMQALEDKAQKAKDRPEGRIQGYSSERQGGAGAARGRAAQRAADSAAGRAGAYSRGFGGLAELNANRIDPNFARPMTPNLDSAFGGKRPESSSDKIAAEIRELKEVVKERLTVD